MQAPVLETATGSSEVALTLPCATVESLRADVTPGGRKVMLFNESLFAELRTLAGVPDDFVNDGWNFSSLKKGGGKGGTLMAFVATSYVVKELSAKDHHTLLSVSGSYFRHVRGEDTLLCPIYLHFRDIRTGRCFYVMRHAVGAGPFKALYDLKGCADDKTIELDGESIEAVHKRFYQVWMWCGQFSWSAERKRYFEGKRNARRAQIVMTREERKKFLHCIEQDLKWLSSNSLMDYSLIVGIKSGLDQATGNLPDETDDAVMQEHERVCISSSDSSLQRARTADGCRPVTRTTSEGEEITLNAAIIDFLQRWTSGKKVARVVKVLEPNKSTIPPGPYAERFLRHFKQRVVLPHSEQAESKKTPAASPIMGATAAVGLATDAQVTRCSFCRFLPGPR